MQASSFLCRFLYRRLLPVVAVLLMAGCNEAATETDLAAVTDAPAGQGQSSSPDTEELTGEIGADAVQKGPGRFLLTQSEMGLPPELASIGKSWTGDFDGMLERRIIRVLTVYQAGGYYLDGPEEKGLTYELVKMFEKFINEKQGTGHVKVHVVLIPVEFDQLLNGLMQGYGDIVAAGMSITPARDVLVDFSHSLSREISEVIITGPASPELNVIDDLAGKQVYAKPGSSYLQSLASLNADFMARGLEAIDVRETDSFLEDVDLLEMVGAGLLPLLVMDNYKANFWADIFDKMKVREDLVIQSDRHLAWAFRDDSPLLAVEVNEFVKTHRQGTLMGNILINRYLKDRKWMENALDTNSFEKFNQTIGLFKQYAGQYGFDYLMIAAQGFQESRLDQSVRSQAGAVGIMQLLPSTAADKNVGIPDIETAESNIHAGVKYLHFVRNRYFQEPGLNDMNAALFSFAAYNAGPARVRGLRKMATEAGLDPDKWFNNVELIAAREIGSETVQYVSNIYKYYLAYSLMNEKQSKAKARSSGP